MNRFKFGDHVRIQEGRRRYVFLHYSRGVMNDRIAVLVRVVKMKLETDHKIETEFVTRINKGWKR